jgi:hypothetical protein
MNVGDSLTSSCWCNPAAAAAAAAAAAVIPPADSLCSSCRRTSVWQR